MIIVAGREWVGSFSRQSRYGETDPTHLAGGGTPPRRKPPYRLELPSERKDDQSPKKNFPCDQVRQNIIKPLRGKQKVS